MALEIETTTPSSLLFEKQQQKVGNYLWWKVFIEAVFVEATEKLQVGEICHLTILHHKSFLHKVGKTEEGFYFIPKAPKAGVSAFPLMDATDLIALAEAVVNLNEQVEKMTASFSEPPF